MQLRNHQFDNGSRRISHFDRVIISVGNLSVGGTGKTPLIEYLIQLLKTSNKIATVSRGYGRRSRGFRIANESDDAKAIGDEPLQLYKKYGDEVIVSVGEERILAIPSVLLDIPETDLFLLDDAFQHRKIGRDFDILLSDYDKPFYEDYVLPMGRLREGREGAKRADCIIITKCPMLDESEKSEIRLKISKYSPETPIYFSRINYLDPLNVFSANDRFFSNNIVLISGLADSSKFVAYAKSKYIVEDHFEYSDHHNFRKLDFDRMLNRIDNLGEELVILTTEKDMVRILNFKEHPLFKKAPIFYVPIAFTIDDKSSFDEMLLKTIEEKKNQN